jgi:ATP-dependent DNA helicase 2 subunit 2
VKPISGLNIEELLKNDSARATINLDNAIPEFKQMVEYSSEAAEYHEAAKQFGAIIRTLVTDSLGDNNYDRATEHLNVFRGEMISMEDPEVYNTFIRDFKNRLFSGELGGDRRELWFQVKGAKLGLIDQLASEQSNITPEEAAEVSKAIAVRIIESLTVWTVL